MSAPTHDAAPTSPSSRPTPRLPRLVVVSAGLAALMVVGGFALLAVVPVALALIGTLQEARLRALRWWAAGLAVAYAVPFALYVLDPDRPASLTKAMHPGFVVLIAAAGVAVILAAVVQRRLHLTSVRPAN
ncbi:hypothetical protein [Actinomycetospora soli]|uniref:hypothetical protein n=1 Tax=Actinomycetospora soli TaxID=2893887 RepID=UPI001E57DD71|nr:hypothetical protein [Actinomycetospora soli]MCD2185851.1 hypothetical protein [Actinomycetospora soli]